MIEGMQQCSLCNAEAVGAIVVKYYEVGHEEPEYTMVTDIPVCRECLTPRNWSRLADRGGTLVGLHCQCSVLVGSQQLPRWQIKQARRYCQKNNMKLRLFDRQVLNTVPLDLVPAPDANAEVMKSIRSAGLNYARAVYKRGAA